jgi:hypothetical protein
LIENGVNHGEFPPTVLELEESEQVLASGQYVCGTESGWKPTLFVEQRVDGNQPRRCIMDGGIIKI